MSVRERDFEVVVISWVEKEANFGSKKSVLLGRRRKEKKKSSDNRVISGFLFFLVPFNTHISPFIVRLFDFCTCAFASDSSTHREIYMVYLYLHTRQSLEE